MDAINGFSKIPQGEGGSESAPKTDGDKFFGKRKLSKDEGALKRPVKFHLSELEHCDFYDNEELENKIRQLSNKIMESFPLPGLLD